MLLSIALDYYNKSTDDLPLEMRIEEKLIVLQIKLYILIKILLDKKLKLENLLLTQVQTHSLFLTLYYLRNENLWIDGFLLDFLQKKSVDLWLRKFVIYTGFLFSERLVFDSLVTIYLSSLLWPLHYFSFFESSTVLEMLTTTVYLYFVLLLGLSLLFILLV